jgi:hypothetical protein
MTAELVRLALRAVIAAVPGWTLWLGLTSFMVAAGTLLLFYERSRRRTYVALLEVIQPGTLLLDRAHRHKKIAIVRLSQPLFIAHSRSVDSGSLKR